jgi:uncharacterized protein
MTHKSFPAHIHSYLKYYVYVYRDPRNHEVFYVGKGQKNRAFSHLNDDNDSAKKEGIKVIRSVGRETEILILAHGLDDELIALKVEAVAIGLLGLHQITNSIRGFESTEFCLMTIDQLVSRYEAEEVEIVDPVCLIRPNRLFRYGMSVQELYDTTRGIWGITPKAHKIAPKFALCIYAGVVCKRRSNNPSLKRPDIPVAPE